MRPYHEGRNILGRCQAHLAGWPRIRAEFHLSNTDYGWLLSAFSLAYALASPAVVTALNPLIGYEEAASVVAAARARGTDVRTVVLERGLVAPDELDRVLDVLAMTRGGRPKPA